MKSYSVLALAVLVLVSLVTGCVGFTGQAESLDDQFLKASKAGDLAAVVGLLEGGANLEATDHFDYTALHLAVQADALDVVEYLLSAGLDANSPGRFGGRAMSSAIMSENLQIMEQLLAYGADLRPEGESSALFTAIANDKPVATEYLLSADKENLADDLLILHAAALSEMWDIIPTLIDRGAPIDAREGKGRGILRYANAHFDTLVLLVELGADVNNIPDDGVPPATSAIMSGRLEAARYLLENGADVNPVYSPQKDDGRTPLPPLFAAAMAVDDLAAFEYLLSIGADPNYVAIDDGGSKITALQILVLNNKEDIAVWLVEQGADPDTADQRRMLKDTATEKGMTRLAEVL